MDEFSKGVAFNAGSDYPAWVSAIDAEDREGTLSREILFAAAEPKNCGMDLPALLQARILLSALRSLID